MNQNQDEKLFTRPDMSPANWSSWSEIGELETGNANIYCKNPITQNLKKSYLKSISSMVNNPFSLQKKNYRFFY